MRTIARDIGILGLALMLTAAACTVGLTSLDVDRLAERFAIAVVVPVEIVAGEVRDQPALSDPSRVPAEPHENAQRMAAGASAALPDLGTEITARAVQTMQRRGDRASRSALVRIANNTVGAEDVRLAALRALGDLPAPDDDTLAMLWRTAEGIDASEACTRAAFSALGRALRQLPGDDARATEGRSRLVQSLRCAMTGPRQQQLLLTLAQAGHPDLVTEALPFLQSEEAAVRAAAAHAVAMADGLAARQIAREVVAVSTDAEVRRILSRSLLLSAVGH